MKTEKMKENAETENVLSYNEVENARSENPASWEFAGTENTLRGCTGLSDAAWNTSKG